MHACFHFPHSPLSALPRSGCLEVEPVAVLVPPLPGPLSGVSHWTLPNSAANVVTGGSHSVGSAVRFGPLTVAESRKVLPTNGGRSKLRDTRVPSHPACGLIHSRLWPPPADALGSRRRPCVPVNRRHHRRIRLVHPRRCQGDHGHNGRLSPAERRVRSAAMVPLTSLAAAAL